MNASTFVDACDYYTMGANVYYLPYFFGRLGPADARDLYGLLYDLVHAGEMSPLESAYRSYQDTRDCRKWENASGSTSPR